MAEENTKETISALIDGELNDKEIHDLVRQLREDGEYRCCWQNYHLIGDAMRKNLPSGMDSELSLRISQSLASEPPLSTASVTPLPAATNKTTHHRNLKPVAGFALAASVAAVAYVGVGMLGSEGDMGAMPRIAATEPAPMMAAPVMAPAMAPMTVSEHYTNQPDMRWDVAQPAVESKLDSYLSNHQAASAAAEMSGKIMPNMRMVVIARSLPTQ